MKEGTHPPAATTADRSDRLRLAQERHHNAVAGLEAAQLAFVNDVNLLPLPELMQGPVVRVTDADSMDKVREVLELQHGKDGGRPLYIQLRLYREMRLLLSEEHRIPDLAEEVALAAAAVARIEQEG